MTGGDERLSYRTGRAAQWRLAGSVVATLSQLGVGVLLARLLTPADFGIVALAMIVIGLVQPLGDLGLGNALVQRATITVRHLRVAFTAAVLAGLTLGASIALAAPLAARLVGDPGATQVLRLLAAVFAFRGVAVVAEALLRRRLEFRRQFYIDCAGYLLGYGGVAGILAIAGFGVWSLVWGALAQAILTAGAQLALVRHPVTPLLARREIDDLLGYGVGASLGSWVNYLALNGDNVVVGRVLGAASLGLYGRAYALMNLPFTHAASVMASVLFPAFARVQGQPARLRRGYLAATQLTAIVAAPAMATLAVAAPHLVPSLYGAQWAGLVAPLQILCAAGYFRALYHLGGMVVRSVGQVYRELVAQVIYAALVIGGTLAAAPHGLPWVAAAVAAAILYMFVATGELALRATGTRWIDYGRVQLGPVATGLATGTVALGVRLILEAQGASSGLVACGVLLAAAVPWSLGLLWHLREPEAEPVRASLPAWCLPLVQR